MVSRPEGYRAPPAGGRHRCPGGVRRVQTAFVLIDAQPDRIAELAGELAAVEGVAEA